MTYLRHHEVYSKDVRTAESQVRVLSKYFTGRALEEITPSVVNTMISIRREEGASEATINRNLAALSKMFSIAIDDGVFIGTNPMRRVRRFKESPARVRFLTADEAARLFDAAAGMKRSPHLLPILQVAILTGGRLSEVLGLRWADIDLAANILYYRRETAKSRKERMIPIVPALHAVLSKLGGGDPQARVFTYRGRPIRKVKTSFSRACLKAGLPDVRFHDTRRTFATGFIMRGGDPYRLQRLLGHQSIEMVQRYARLSPEYIKAGADFIGMPTHRKGR